MRIRFMGICLLLLVLPPLGAQEARPVGVLSFWVKSTNGQIEEIASNGFYVAQPGDWFQFKVTVPPQGYLQVFHLPSEGGIVPLRSDGAPPNQGTFSYPAPPRWFTLEGNPGQEEFVFVTSRQPMNELNALLTRDRREDLYAYLKALKTMNSRLAESGRVATTSLGAPLRASVGILLALPENDVAIQSFFLVH